MRPALKRSLRVPCTAALAVIALLAPGTVAAAEAARPAKGAVYAGRTSQGSRVDLKVSRSGRGLEAAAMVRTQCARLGRRSVYAIAVLVPVRGSGRFSDASVDSDVDLSLEPILVDGRRKRVFDVTVTRLSGSFASSRRARGSWRVESAVYDRATFPADDRPFDKCDTGEVTWTARRR